MLEGRVTVNGVTVRELGTKADASRDDIRVDGRRVKLPERNRYLLLNKPRGYVTTRKDPQRRPTVIDLLRGIGEYVYPVGRLDFESEGLLLLTNDGDLAARLTHPRHGVAGVTVEGRRTTPAEVQLDRRSIRSGAARQATLTVTIREGRNRQVRNMCEAIGHPVIALRRIAIGPIRDAKLKPGQWRELTADEVQRLRSAAARVHTRSAPTS